MMTEELQFVMIILCGMLWRAGGAGYLPFKKAWRRMILPLLIFSVGLGFYGLTPPLVYITLVAMIVFSLGYGEKHCWFTRVFVAVAYGFYDFQLGINSWSFVVPVAWLGLYYMSNSKWRYHFSWALCETLFGIVLGCKVITQLGLM